MAGLLDFLPFIGSLFDSSGNSDRYGAQAAATMEQLKLQREMMEKSADWSGQNNEDLMAYILGQNPLAEEEQAGVNEGNFDFAEFLNELRGGYATDVNDQLEGRLAGADNLAGKNFRTQDRLGGDIFDIAMGRDPSMFVDASEDIAGQLSENPYDLESMMADAESAATMAVDRQYGKLMDNVSRDAVRQGTDASQSLLDLGSQSARDAVEATLKARLGTPSAYEAASTSRAGRLTNSMSALEGAASGIDSRAMAGLRGAGDMISGASNLGINTLLHKPDYEDPSEGMNNPLERFQSVLNRRANPFAAQTNPYSGLKPAIPAFPKVQEGKTNYGTLGAALEELLSGM